jgi:mannose-6-phosphate isomerase-like protein (cupin superfamily)
VPSLARARAKSVLERSTNHAKLPDLEPVPPGPYDLPQHKERRFLQSKGETITRGIKKNQRPLGKIAHRFEGYRYGEVDVSFFLVNTPPGTGPVLHTHPYEEIFVVQEGEATYTVGDDTIEVSAGQIVVAPAGVPHKFVNSGTGPLRQVDIHPSERIQQVDIPEDV